MNILIPTIGTRGDVQPYIALAEGLMAGGHSVTIATHPIQRSLVESYQVPFAPVGPDVDLALETNQIYESAWHWVGGFKKVMDFSFDMLEKIHDDLLQLCGNLDLMIVSHTGAGSIEADQLGLPKISVTLFPQAIPVNDPDSLWLMRAAGKLAGKGMALFMEAPLNRIRARLSIDPMGPEGITSSALNLIPISPHVHSPDSRWEERHQMTGYWFAPMPETWQPSSGLRSFLESGPPPVVISLGAMAVNGKNTNQLVGIILEAIDDAGVRGVIQGWQGLISQDELPSTIYHAGSVPHDWLLSRSAGVVHHGGFGSTAAGLRAGIPSLAIPHIIDQFMWGQKIFDLGAGPRPIPRKKLSADVLAEALREMADNQSITQQAKCLGEKIQAEDGVKTACELIKGLYS